MYYVYIYLDPRRPGSHGFDFEPFYIGKGKEARAVKHLWEAKTTKGKSTNHRINRIRGILNEGLEPIVLYLYRNLTHEDACQYEIQLIAQIGRQDLGTGPLLNLTDGGEGTPGRVYSEETKAKISQNHADFTGDKHPSWGMKRSEETLKKISATSKGRVHSEETKRRISENTKKALAARKITKS